MMSPENCASLHGFILGIPLIETLHEMRPPLGGTSMEEAYGISKKREGYEECLANIISLANRGTTAPITSSFVDTLKHDEPVPREEQEAAAQGA
jgi:hypothetical protein